MKNAAAKPRRFLYLRNPGAAALPRRFFSSWNRRIPQPPPWT